MTIQNTITRGQGRKLSRRDLLRVGSLGLMGLSLPELLQAQEEPHVGFPAKADACIIIFLNGGPSHLDMWDMKPDAPDGIRGEFKPIATSAPGILFSEHMPKLAKMAHHCSLVRSMHHGVNNAHALAVYTAMTGHDKGDANKIVGNSDSDQPTPGAMASYLRPAARNVVPHVVLPYKTKEGAKGPPQPGFFGGALGREYDPLFILKDPNAKDFSVPEFTLRPGITSDRLVSRHDLLSRLNDQLEGRSTQTPFEAMSQFQHRALDVLTSSTVRQAFELGQEPDKIRDSYGRNIYGQSVLLARRMIEAGTRVATISWAPDANATWDTHGSNFQKLKDPLLPQFDAACSSLISDLQERGMLERTLVAVLGDFGRTPKINKNNAGRDHWNYCYTVMLAGGGVPGGFVYGASDKTGAFPADTPTTPGDLIATMYRLLGIDHKHLIYDRFKRPHRVVPHGDVIQQLIS